MFCSFIQKSYKWSHFFFWRRNFCSRKFCEFFRLYNPTVDLIFPTISVILQLAPPEYTRLSAGRFSNVSHNKIKKIQFHFYAFVGEFRKRFLPHCRFLQLFNKQFCHKWKHEVWNFHQPGVVLGSFNVFSYWISGKDAFFKKQINPVWAVNNCFQNCLSTFWIDCVVILWTLFVY